MKSEYLCPNVPEDVVIEILSRLPVKSLVRFRCVCKSWYALIKNPRFIAKHLLLNQCDSGTLMNNNNNASLLVMRYHSITERYVLSFLSNETLDVSVNLELRFFCEEPEAPRILGPCNGIFCVYCFDKPAVLWNPAIREFKALPLSGVPHPPATKAVYVDGLGFGFDPITNDYKVVRFVDLWFDGSNRKSTIVELYTLSTDSWKEIDAHSVLPCITMGGNTFNKKGIFHWWALDEDGLMVLSFDMGDEVFLKTPLPDCGSVVDGFSKRLAVLNESLVLVAFTFRGTESCFDIWVLNEYGLKESWTKQLTIGPILGDYSPLGFWKGDEFLLEESETGRLFSYHPTTQEIKELQVDGVPSTLQAFNYMESLVSIKGGYDHEQQDNSSDILPLPFSVHELSCIK